MYKLKKYIVILLLLCLLNITCFADCSDNQIQKDVEFVESLKLFEPAPESEITRRTMLYTFVNIADVSYEKYNFEDVKFADIKAESSDFKAASFAVNYGLFTGKYYENDTIVADLDCYATWKEVMIVALRSLNISFNANDDEEILFWLQYSELDEFFLNDKIDEILNERVGYKEYCCFINRVIHTPYINWTYGGEITEYHIDKFIFRR